MQELDSIHNTESTLLQDSNPFKEARNTESRILQFCTPTPCTHPFG
ncbi:hypothetical protein [Helicobacter bilis]|nr:hypothetical protein [Helicobacter bilis]MCI7410189.1 hypothetical protein [Helicobacter bilis]MDD7296910.1 hypothetical protein [Helicobacter bilis]MDY4400225.1 hypothetical protein [Helicobacter bilis]